MTAVVSEERRRSQASVAEWIEKCSVERATTQSLQSEVNAKALEIVHIRDQLEAASAKAVSNATAFEELQEELVA